MINFYEEFIQLAESKNTLRKLKNKLSSIEKEIAITEEKFNSLKITLAKEKKDVDKLESISFSYLFYKMKGNKDEQLSKEKFEYLEAQARFMETDDYLKRLLSNKESIIKEISHLDNIESKYDKLLEESSNYILSLKNDNSKEISEFIDKIRSYSLEKKEILEALSEGDKLIPSIDNTISNLNSASNWGVYDMLGGDFIATMAKRSKMKDASDSINSVKIMLNRYNSELDDLSENINITLDLGGFTGAMDYIFDNFFTDYIIQDKIHSALNSAKALKSKVIEIQNTLNNNFKETEIEITKLKQELEQYIINNKI